MQVTVVSHAGIANRIKNILSAMSQYDVSTKHETINYLFPSIPLEEDPSRICLLYTSPSPRDRG